ncbi:MAG: NAD(P)/FAD-dependent oxidoreductase [Armatimonadota bacterium]
MATIRQTEPDDYEVIVVGGSFSGLSAALQVARARRKVLVIDAGKPRNRFAKAAHGFMGQDGRTPAEILDTARRQVLAYPTVRITEGEAKHARRIGERFQVTLGNGRQLWTRRLILATGVTDHLPEIPGMKELWGRGVMHCPYCHGYEVADRGLAVLGTSEKSAHQALLVRDWSSDVTLLTNGTDTLTDEDRERLKQRNVKIVEAPLARLIPRGRELAGVELKDGRTLPLAGLFIAPRCSLTSPLAQELGCEIEDGASGPVIKTDAFKETTVPGVFAAGDAARPLHSITFASADGVMAGVFAHQSLVFR